MENLKGIHSSSQLTARCPNESWLGFVGDRVERVLERWKGEQFTGDWRVLTGSRILDLGCGTSLAETCHVYPPYFCRIAVLNGAEVFGIDQSAPSSEDAAIFNHIQADFVDAVSRGKLGDLFTFQNSSFDIIHLWRLMDTYDPFMENSLRKFNFSTEQFFELLVSQCGNLLLDGGLLAVEDKFLNRDPNSPTLQVGFY